MRKGEELKLKIRELGREELAAFRAWFGEFHSKGWDAQIEEDALTDKLDRLVEEALRDYRAGGTKKL